MTKMITSTSARASDDSAPDARHDALWLVCALVTFSVIAALLGLLDHGVAYFTPAPARVYCAAVGDDDCNGMIIPTESGWRCVPTGGGPLLCRAGTGLGPNGIDQSW